MKPERTKEEIIADVLGWESFSPGPVMANTDDFLKAMEEYRQSSPVEPSSPTVVSDEQAIELIRSCEPGTKITITSPTVKESKTGEQEDKPAVTITLSFDVPTFGKFISFMKTNDDLWPDFKESLMQLKDKIESWKEMK